MDSREQEYRFNMLQNGIDTIISMLKEQEQYENQEDDEQDNEEDEEPSYIKHPKMSIKKREE